MKAASSRKEAEDLEENLKTTRNGAPTPEHQHGRGHPHQPWQRGHCRERGADLPAWAAALAENAPAPLAASSPVQQDAPGVPGGESRGRVDAAERSRIFGRRFPRGAGPAARRQHHGQGRGSSQQQVAAGRGWRRFALRPPPAASPPRSAKAAPSPA